MLNLNAYMVGSSNAKKLAEFYTKILGKKPDFHDYGWYGWQIGKGFLTVGDHSKVKGKSKNPERMMFTFETKQVQKEFDRMVKLGAKVVKKPYKLTGGMIATLADPDGNYFQLMTPWEG